MNAGGHRSRSWPTWTLALAAFLVACAALVLTLLPEEGGKERVPFDLSAGGGSLDIRTGRIDIRDSQDDGKTTTKKLLDYGPFKFVGSCRDLGSFSNGVTVESSQKAYGVGMTESTDPDEIGETPTDLAPSAGSANAGAVNPRSLTAFTPGGKFVSVTVFEVNRPTNNDQIDCSFWVFGHGRK